MIKEALVAKVLRAAKGVVSKGARRANEARRQPLKTLGRPHATGARKLSISGEDMAKYLKNKKSPIKPHEVAQLSSRGPLKPVRQHIERLSQKDLTKRRTPASAILSRIKIKSAKERQTDMINYLADRRARNAIPPDKFKKGYSQKIL